MAKFLNSITCVFNGDWNNLFMQPDWIAQNIFQQDTLEVSVNGYSNNISVAFKNENVVLHPSQMQVVFNFTKESCDSSYDYFCQCINNYLKKAHTTMLTSYGINGDFLDQGDVYTSIVDDMKDNNGLMENSCEIVSTRVSKTVRYDKKVFNIETFNDNGDTKIHINEHHEGPFEQKDYPKFDKQMISDFVRDCWHLLFAIGYEKEE